MSGYSGGLRVTTKRGSFGGHDDRTSVAYDDNRRGRGASRSRGGFVPYRGGRARGKGRGYHTSGEDDVDMHNNNDNAGSFRPMRHNPYDRRSNSRGPGRGKFPGRGKYYESGGMRKSTRLGYSPWYKIIVPHGSKVDKDFLFQQLNSLCNVPFIPKHYTVDKGGAAQFFVQDREAANAIRDASKKITTPNGFKLIFITRACQSLPQAPLNEETVTKLKVCMSNRYDPAAKSLNLHNLYYDTELKKEGIQISLSRYQVMQLVVKIVEENIPELTQLDVSETSLHNLDNFKYMVDKAPNITKLNIGRNKLKQERELEKLKDWKLLELNLDGNPLCDNFSDTNKYISTIRKIFPKIVRLDGNDLPPAITFDTDENTALPPTQPSYFCNDQCKTVIIKFLEQYINLYDSGNRQGLLEAYHDHVIFSIACSSGTKLPGQRGSMKDYIRESRNLQRITVSNHREKLIKMGRLNVVATINDLPATQHDTTSFVVDVGLATPQLLSFTVHGVFRERESKLDPQPIKAFSRMFNLVPKGSGVVVINEELSLQFATQDQIKNSFKSPAPTPSSSPVLTVPGADQQQQLVQQFSAESGMNLEWATQCLVQNDWDFQKAASVFSELKVKGTIPDEAFLK